MQIFGHVYTINQSTRLISIGRPSTGTVRRRRQRDAEKIKRQHGEAYISNTGCMRLARSMRPRCRNCRFQCASITDDGRQRLFAEYYGLGDIHSQWQYIARCVHAVVAKYSRRGADSQRQATYAYTFRVVMSPGDVTIDDDDVVAVSPGDGQTRPVRVCKLFFLNTLAISNMVTRSAIAKCTASGELLERDQRGGYARRAPRRPVGAASTMAAAT